MKNTERSTVIKKMLFAGFSLLVLLLLRALPLPGWLTDVPLAPLTGAGQATVAITVFCLLMWITQALPFHITGLLALVLFALFRVDTFNEVVRNGFGSNTVIFFLSVLILSAFISESGLGRRALTITLSITGNSTRLILLSFLLVGILATMWVTAMAVTAMMVPMALEILRREKLEPLKSNFGRALLMSCAYGPVIGGMSTPAGAGCNPLAIEFLRDMAGVEISFLGWMRYGVPCALLLLLPVWFVLTRLFPPEMACLSVSSEELKAGRKALPAMSHDEKATLAVFLLTILLWLTSTMLEGWLDIEIPVAMPACLAACLMFLPGMTGIGWKRIEGQISWSGIILILSGISLGSMLYKTGAAKWMAAVLLGGIGGLPLWVQVFLVAMITILMKVAFSSNTVTATIIIPILIALAAQLNLSPMLLAFPAALASPLSLILVTSSPNNIIPYSTGYFTVGDMAKTGLLLMPVAAAVIACVVALA